MTLKIHNTLSDSLDEFRPIQAQEVRMYSCGPTVYDYAHIGNLRAYIFSDVVRRTFEYLGYSVEQVVNITDIGHLTSDADSGEDKMIKGIKREGLEVSLESMKILADKYTEKFKEDILALNIELPHALPRASEHIAEDILLIETLEKKGYAYKTGDGIYFDTGKVKNYGKLGGLTPIDEAQSRVDEEKKSPRDFTLWKFSNDEKMSYPSPWGHGFPGWHIECSVMSRKFLGQPFDIHTGGVDHIPVHHNNEIAQSESAYDEPLANYWMHNEFIKIGDEKIAKSAGNYLVLSDLIEKGFSPLAYRYLLLQSHYRTPTTFTWEALEASSKALAKLQKLVSGLPDGGSVSEEYKKKFTEKIENDFNTAQALAVVWTLAKDKSVSDEDKKATLLDFDKVLGLNLT